MSYYTKLFSSKHYASTAAFVKYKAIYTSIKILRKSKDGSKKSYQTRKVASDEKLIHPILLHIILCDVGMFPHISFPSLATSLAR